MGDVGRSRKFLVLPESAVRAPADADDTTGVSAVSLEHEQLIAFLGELLLQALSPANLPLTNPEVLAETRKQKGKNLLRGLNHALADLRRSRSGERAPGTERFRVGKEVAITPGISSSLTRHRSRGRSSTRRAWCMADPRMSLGIRSCPAGTW